MSGLPHESESGLNRRHFLGFTGGLAAAGIAASAGLKPFGALPADALAARAGMPWFSWDHVPVAADLGNRDALFSPSEAEFIGNHFGFISIEKGAAIRAQPEGQQWAETGFYEDARRIKAANARCKVLMYFGMKGPNSLSLYHDGTGWNEAWSGGVKGDKGKELYNYAIPEMREWW